MSVITITKENFKSEVLDSDKPVLIDFWASWCGPCRMMAPVIDAVAEELNDVKVGKINIDEESELASAFKIMSIPTIMLVNRGEVVNPRRGGERSDRSTSQKRYSGAVERMSE